MGGLILNCLGLHIFLTLDIGFGFNRALANSPVLSQQRSTVINRSEDTPRLRSSRLLQSV